MARIYVASSWRNPYQEGLVEYLRQFDHAVYDFKHDSRKDDSPHPGVSTPPATAFSWAEMDPEWKTWTPDQYRTQVLASPRAAQGYVGDLRGMEWADTCVLCLPAGNSAHIEAGYMKGRGKRVIIYFPENVKEFDAPAKAINGTVFPASTWEFQPDLMYLLGDNICIGKSELVKCLNHGEWNSKT